MIGRALIFGIIWSVLWMGYVYMILKCFPWEMVHEYPDDVKDACTIKTPSDKKLRIGKLIGGIYSIILFVLLVIFNVIEFKGTDYNFLTIVIFTFIVAFTWNLIDLLIVDWLLVCTVTPKWVVLEGTEGCKGYKDYMFHFKGFLIGCVYMVIVALMFGAISFGIIHLL